MLGTDNGTNGGSPAIAEAALEHAEREVREAVVDVSEPDEQPVTKEDVDKLREDDLEELAVIAERYVSA